MAKIYRLSIMFKLLLVVLTLCCSLSEESYAAPATPKPITVTQDDGSTITIQLHGDEYFHWQTASNGYPIAKKEGYYYYVNYEADGKMVFSSQRVSGNNRTLAPSIQIQKQDVQQIATVISAQMRSRALTSQQKTNFPNSGKVKSVVILVEFFDVDFSISNPNSAFDNLLNQEGYSDGGAVGSAADYFRDNSNGAFEGDFDVYGPYTLSQPRKYYGGNSDYGGDLRPAEMIEEAVELADKSGVDFSQYDLDGDGLIDNVFVYYAGNNEAESGVSESVWPHKWVVSNKPSFDGKQLYDYACTSELRGAQTSQQIIAGIGTFCHEFLHVLGLSDHYDTTGSIDGYSYGLGDYDIMTSGNYNEDGDVPPMLTALERTIVGWSEAVEIDDSHLGYITLQPISSGEVYKITTEVEGEYFLLENRNKSNIVWDEPIPGEGLFITHVDMSAPYANAWAINAPNGSLAHECYKFVVASNQAPTELTGWEYVPYPYKESTSNQNYEWSQSSIPKAESWSGKIPPYKIMNISKSSENIVFKVDKSEASPLIVSVKETYDSKPLSNATVEVKSLFGETFTVTSNAAGNAEFIEMLMPNGDYTMTVSSPDYATYTTNFYLENGMTYYVSLYTEEQAKMEEVTYSNKEFGDALGFVGYGMFRPIVVMGSDMLKKYVGCKLKEIRFYAANKLEALIMVQCGSGWFAPSYGTDQFTITESQIGWRAVDFSDDEIIIEDNTEYYFQIMVTNSYDDYPPIGLDNDTSLRYDNYSNKVMFQTGETNSIYYETGLTGNIMLTATFSEESTVAPPTELIPGADFAESVSITVTEERQISWSSLPEGSNPYCDWVSSDSSIAAVSSTGVVYGMGIGTATLTATSVRDANVTMQITVNVDEKDAKGKGRVVEYGTSSGVEGIELEFRPIYPEPPYLAAGGAAFAPAIGSEYNSIKAFDLSKFYISKAAEEKGVAHAISDANGDYSVDGLIAGCHYNIILSQDQFSDPWASRTTTTSATMVAYDAEDEEGTINNLGNFGLIANSVYGKERFRYYDGDPDFTFAGTPESATMYAVKFPAESLVDNIGDRISDIDAFFNNMLDSYVEAIVFTLDSEGKLVFQVGLPYGDTGDPQNGYHLFSFTTATPTIIRPGVDYYVTMHLMGQVGFQELSGSNAYDGLGNLVWNGVKFETLSQAGIDANGNWQIAMFLEDRAIDPVTEVVVSQVDPDAAAIIGIPLQLTATVAPTTAAYTDVEWSSSDSSVAEVSVTGEVTFFKNEEVTIYATSSKYSEVKGEYTITPELVQGVEIDVIDSDGNTALGSVVRIYEGEMITSTSQTLTRNSYRKVLDGTELHSATIDESGVCFFELQEGIYIIEAQCDGLVSYTGVLEVGYGLNFSQVMLTQYVENLSTFMCYTTPAVDVTIGDLGYNFVPFVRWSASDMENYVGQKITRLKTIATGYSNIRFLIFNDDVTECIYRSEIIEVQDGASMVVHEIPSDDYVEIQEGKEYCIGFEVSSYSEEIGPAVLSTQSTTIEGKGDCIVYRGETTDLTSLLGEPSGNWVMGFYLQDDEQLKGVEVNIGQREATMSWNPQGYTEFAVSWNALGATDSKREEITDCKFQFTNLEPATKYEVQVVAKNKYGDYEGLCSTTFTTLNSITAVPLIKTIDAENLVSGKLVEFEVLNTLSTDKIQWLIDGESLSGNIAILSSGKHKLQCRTLRDGKVLITTRFINVL